MKPNESAFIESLSAANDMHNLAESFHNRVLDSTLLPAMKPITTATSVCRVSKSIEVSRSKQQDRSHSL